MLRPSFSALSLTFSLGLCACGAPSDAGESGGGETGGINVMTVGETTLGEPGTATTDAGPTTDGASTTTGPEPQGTSGSSSGGATTTGVVDDGSSSGSAESDSSTTMDCPSAVVNFDPVIPTVVLLIDQSGSMTSSFDGQARWDAVEEALTDPVTGVIASLQDEVRFGVALYTSNNGDAGGACPILTEDPPDIGNLDDIAALFAANSPEDETPTGESIEAVAAALLLDPAPGPKIIVVATDGEPDTCAVPNPQEGQSLAVGATETAYASGIETFIISVGSDVSQSHLQDMANAGVGWMPGDENAPFYVPSDQAAMVAAFSDIINGVRSCVFELDGSIQPGREDEGTVTVNGTEIPYDDADGWRVNGASEIELLGAACAMIQAGDVDIDISFSCEAILPG